MNFENVNCKITFENIIEFLNKNSINSVTFDFRGFDIISSYKKFNTFKWHIWHVDSLESFDKIIKKNNIGIILLSNDKFFNNLN